MTYTKEQVKAAYDRLPQAVKEIFGDIQTEDDVVEIGGEHHLHIDQIGKLNHQVTLVLLGLQPVNNFLSAIQTEAGLDSNTANEIADKINRAIFLKVREEMQQISKPNLSELAPAATLSTLSAEQVLREVENPPPAVMATGIREQGIGNSGAGEKAAEAKPAEQAEPDLLEKKLAKTFILPRVESATQEDVDPYREMPQ